MKQAIDELKAIPGVVGACLFGSQEGLLQSNLPEIFKAEKLTAVGKQLTKLLMAGRMSFADINDLSLYYDESVIIARELSKGMVIFVVCDPSFNHNLLTMSLNLLQEELRDNPAAALAAPSVNAAPVATASAGAELEPLMKELTAALAKVLGPMAGIIFNEVRQAWAAQGATSARLPQLIEMLNEEIGDPDKVATFEPLAAPLLQQ